LPPGNFENNYSHFFTNKIKNLDYYFSKLQKPDVLFNFKKESFFKNKVKFFNSEKKFFQLLNDKLKNIVGKFDIGSHQNILKRGYAYIKNLKDNSFIKSAKNIEEKTNLTITFHDGSIEAISKKK
jgi:exonuclease VII large subunit